MKKLFVLLPLLTACAQSASETAAEAALQQADNIQQIIAKQCPAAEIDSSILALKASIKTQLATCEAEKSKLKEKNNTLLAILIGLIAVIVAFNWVKIKTKVLK